MTLRSGRMSLPGTLSFLLRPTRACALPGEAHLHRECMPSTHAGQHHPICRLTLTTWPLHTPMSSSITGQGRALSSIKPFLCFKPDCEEHRSTSSASRFTFISSSAYQVKHARQRLGHTPAFKAASLQGHFPSSYPHV